MADKCCVRCGSTEDLELDHIDPSTKHSESKNTSGLIWSWCTERREAELAKCQILCKSCHLTKTRENEEWGHKGETNGHSKLTEAQVIELLTSTEPVRVLAKRFGVGRTHIYRIRRGEEWAHLQAEYGNLNREAKAA
jgi:hypothetical protein